jgi:hypothetical protein
MSGTCSLHEGNEESVQGFIQRGLETICVLMHVFTCFPNGISTSSVRKSPKQRGTF